MIDNKKLKLELEQLTAVSSDSFSIQHIDSPSEKVKEIAKNRGK